MSIMVISSMLVASCLLIFFEHSKFTVPFVITLAILLSAIIALIIYFLMKTMGHKLLFISQHDPITQLPNRAYFFDYLSKYLEKDDNELPFAIMTIGIDRFPQINQALGYQIGDRLLNHVAQRLEKELTQVQMLARLASNVFIVIVPEITPQNYQPLADKVMDIFSTPFSVYTVQIDIDVLIGFSFYPQDDISAAPLIQKADLALYAARYDVDRIDIYQQNKDPHHRNKISLMSELRDGINQNEFRVFYQPKVDLTKGHITQVETLIRWFHPRRGDMCPQDFIPLAEETGHLKNLTFWLLEKGIIQCRAWEQAGTPLGVSVNLSVKDLLNRKLPDYVAALIKEHQLTPSLLTLEITESAFMREPKSAITASGKLLHLGVNLSIDDFGTGFSSLSYLKQLPVNELKLDKSFIQDILHVERDAKIVESTINMGHTLGMHIVAEGVSDESTLNMLKDLKCDLGQGFYFAEPLPIEALTAWLSTSPWGFSKN